MVSPYRAVYETPSMPEAPLSAAASSTVPLLTGTTTNESTGFLTALGLLDMNWLVGRKLLGYLGADRRVRRAYRVERGLRRTRDVVEAAWTDWTFRAPTIHLLEARTAPSYLYEFTWPSPGRPEGIAVDHALEVPFMRDELQTLREIGPAGAALIAGAPQALATAMHKAWVDFARTGDPGWPVYATDGRTTMIFGEKPALTNDPHTQERRAWAGKR